MYLPSLSLWYGRHLAGGTPPFTSHCLVRWKIVPKKHKKNPDLGKWKLGILRDHDICLDKDLYNDLENRQKADPMDSVTDYYTPLKRAIYNSVRTTEP